MKKFFISCVSFVFAVMLISCDNGAGIKTRESIGF
jgi:hypothetical protein